MGKQKIEQYKEQNFRKLRKNLRSTGLLFEDPLFPANDHSLKINSSRVGYRPVIWKRPADLAENPRLFVEKASSKDVTQGRLGNCWFVAACSALATVKPLWREVVPDYKDQEWNDEEPDNYAGIFHFRFWRFGKWLDIVVDDRLPTVDGELIFCHSTTQNEFWSALLEKAYAKLCGSYGAMDDGGNLCDALVDFTSGISEMVEMRREGYDQNEEKKETLRKQILRKHEDHALMCCAIAPTDSSQMEARTKTGLIIGHAYGITAVREINLGSSGLLSLFKTGEKLTLLRLRNPWGAKEWTGPFSDGNVGGSSPGNGDGDGSQVQVSSASCSNNNGGASNSDKSPPQSPGHCRTPSCTSHSEYAYTVEQCLQLHSRSVEWTRISKGEKEKLGLTFEDDGEFWMPYDDFVSEFTDLSICDLINTCLFTFRKRWYESFHLGQWTKPNHSGGCINHPTTFLQNPQFLFDIPKDETEVMVHLVQKDRREGTMQSDAYNSIGFHIMRVEDNREHRAHKQKEKTATSAYIKSRSVFFQGSLSKGRYILLPTTFEPGVETEFMLRLYTDARIKVKELKKDYPEPSWLCAPFCAPPSCVTTITVEGAHEIVTSENTFCLIKVEGQKLKSRVIYGSPDPQWNLFGVFFRYDVCKPIFVELWERRWFRDRFLGCAVIQGAADNEFISNKFQLVGRGRKAADRHPGEVKVTVATYDDLNST